MVSNNRSRVKCWGGIGNENEGQFGKLRMQSIVTGISHVCGVTRYGTLKCRGKNDSGQVDVPFHSPFEFSNNLALGVGITVVGFRQGMDVSFVGEEDQEDQSLEVWK